MRKVRVSRTEVYGTESAPLIALVPLPFGLGLFAYVRTGKGLFSSYTAVRSYEWARYDYADHRPANAPRWSSRVLQEQPEPSSRLGIALEAWIESKRPKVIYSWSAN